MKFEVINIGNPIIRNGTDSVSQEEFNSPILQNIIDGMIETMRDQNGVGIAAPQVGISKKIIVIAELTKKQLGSENTIPLTVIINPVLEFISDSYETDWEGCLSIAYANLHAQVSRPSSIQVSGLDRYGQPLEFEASGFFARVIQHEIDHLEGKVFLDRLKDNKTLTHKLERQIYWEK